MERVENGAGEGARTLDFDLGKKPEGSALTSPFVTTRDLNSRYIFQTIPSRYLTSPQMRRDVGLNVATFFKGKREIDHLPPVFSA